MTTIVSWLEVVGDHADGVLAQLARAGVVFVVAWAAAAALRRRAAAVRAALWTTAFGAVVALPLLGAWLPPLRWAGLERSLTGWFSADGAVEPPPRAAHAADASNAETLAAALRLDPSVWSAIPATPVDAGAVDAGVADRGAGQGLLPSARVLAGGLVLAWCVGVLVSLARLGAGLARAWRVVRDARPAATPATFLRDPGFDLPHGVSVLVSRDAAAPFVLDAALSVRRAVLVLAEDTAPRDLAAVWLHERAHLQRRDGVVLLLARVAVAFHWPIAGLALRRLAFEVERACDDAVLRGGVRASDYAATLLALASPLRRTPDSYGVALGVTSGTGERLVARVEALLAEDAPRAALAARGVVVLVAVASAVVLPLAALGQGPRAEAPQEPASRAPQPTTAEQPTAAEQEAARLELLARSLSALVALQGEDGAWRGDVGYKLNSSWSVTAANVPHVGATALAVEALVVAGTRRDESARARALAAGVRFLLGTQDEAGYFTAHGTRMREHALAVRALGRVVGADAAPEPEVLRAWQRGVDFILAAQGLSGGWRFTPTARDSDIVETSHQLGALLVAELALGRVSTPSEAASLYKRIAEAFVRARVHVAAHWVPENAEAAPSRISGSWGFRFQVDPNSRLALDSTAAGLAATAFVGTVEGVDWRAAASAFERHRAEREAAPGLSARHFLEWEADLAACRAIEVHTVAEPTEADVARRDAWRARDLARLAGLEGEAGGWSCDVGPGAAYFTAAACLRLAHVEL